MLKRLISALALSASLIPFSALAATPQQNLNQALQNIRQDDAKRMEGAITFRFRQRSYIRNNVNADGQIKLSFAVRTERMGPDSRRNQEGLFRIEDASITVREGSQVTTTSLDQPFTIEWRYVGGIVFFRLTEVPASLIEMLSGLLELDASVFVGRWFYVNPGDETIAEETSSFQQVIKDLNIATTTAIAPFRVVRVEKKTTDEQGHEILRLRARVNAAVLSDAKRAEIAMISRTDPSRAMMIQAINKRYAELRRRLLPIEFVFVVDTTVQKLLRFEVGGRFNEPQQACSYNFTARRIVCRTIGTRTFGILGGVSFLPELLAPIESPPSAQDLKAFLNSLMPTLDEGSTVTAP